MCADIVFKDRVVERIVEFLQTIGISISRGSVDDGAFLPGINVVAGGLVVDESKLKFPGDLLHEAGHLAVTRSVDRAGLTGEVATPGEIPELVEAAAILWSYAASIYLDLDPGIVFHSGGYFGRSEALLRTFELGVFPGVQGLAAAGMTLLPADAERLGQDPFPVMEKWLRD